MSANLVGRSPIKITLEIGYKAKLQQQFGRSFFTTGRVLTATANNRNSEVGRWTARHT